MNKLILIDGSSYIYRAFHALPRLSNAKGEPTGALFGLDNMLRTLLSEDTQRVAFVLDAPGPTFRHQLYPHYKAHRPPMPEALRAQMQPISELIEALGLPLICVQGVEADDVIGTLALTALQQDIKVIISSGDKDFAQLVRPNISLQNTMTGETLADESAVQEKFGVLPSQIIDLLALMGDASDNIIGVNKCGQKTATKWLQTYKTLENIIAHAEKITGKVGENLRDAITQLPQNKILTTIKTDVALSISLDGLIRKSADSSALTRLYTRFQCTKALQALQAQTNPSAATTKSQTPESQSGGEYTTINSAATLQTWIEQLYNAGYFAFDTETDALNAMQARLVGISFSCKHGQAAYIPLGHQNTTEPQLPLEKAVQMLQPIFADPAIKKCAQNGKYDLHVLRRHGIEVRGFTDDTMLESFVLDSGANRHDLDNLAKRHLQHQMIRYEDVCGKGAKQISFACVGLEQATHYAAEDADYTLQLHNFFQQRMLHAPTLEQVYRDIEIPLVPVIERMESHGVLIDATLLRQHSAELLQKMHDAQQEAFALVGRTFNLDSTKQLQTILFEEYNLPVQIRTPKGQPSCNEEALRAIAHAHPLPAIILHYRTLSKLHSTYTEKLPQMIHPHTNRVHTSYHQAGAATGRLSSSEPNLQNIPIRTEEGRRIRQAFIAPPGYQLLACDYSQIELRIMAHVSNDPALIAAFNAGEDIHQATAAEVFSQTITQVSREQRRAAKAINFGLMYGMSAFGLARQLNISRSQAEQYITLYFTRYPGVYSYMQQVREQARQCGYVETVFGRRLHLLGISSAQHKQRSGSERAAINAPMQGTAADIIKRAMIAIDAWIQPHHAKARMLMQVHDELVFEVRDDFLAVAQQEIVKLMESAAELQVPLCVSAGSGKNWDQAH